MMSDYERIATAIEFISDTVTEQPSLETIASHVNLSPQHFQRLFSRWAGISPKKFLQTLTVEHAKERLKNSSILLSSEQLGLSSPARLHDHFVTLEAMTPGEYRAQGQGLEIFYGVYDSPFGEMFLANTTRGICKLIFLDQDQRQVQLEQAIIELRQSLGASKIEHDQEKTKLLANAVFSPSREQQKLFVVGTNFQINVWKALLEVP